MESRQSNSQLVINDLMRVKWEYDRVDIMRLATLDQLLSHAVRRNASDLLLIAGAPPMLRVNGALAPVTAQ